MISDWWANIDGNATGVLVTAGANVVLALITLIYVCLVRKTLKETRKMAKATQELAQSSRRPNLVIEKDPDTHFHQIKNTGSGLAKDIRITLRDDEPTIDVHAEIHPGGITAAIDRLKEAHHQYETVKLSCKDELGIWCAPFWFKYTGPRQGWVATAPPEERQ